MLENLTYQAGPAPLETSVDMSLDELESSGRTRATAIELAVLDSRTLVPGTQRIADHA